MIGWTGTALALAGAIAIGKHQRIAALVWIVSNVLLLVASWHDSINYQTMLQCAFLAINIRNLYLFCKEQCLT